MNKLKPSRNKAEGHFYGIVNGRAVRVSLSLRSIWVAKGRQKTRTCFQFGPVSKRY